MTLYFWLFFVVFVYVACIDDDGGGRRRKHAVMTCGADEPIPVTSLHKRLPCVDLVGAISISVFETQLVDDNLLRVIVFIDSVVDHSASKTNYCLYCRV